MQVGVALFVSFAYKSLCVLRYGSPGDVEPSYNLFAVYYMKTFNSGSMEDEGRKEEERGSGG